MTSSNYIRLQKVFGGKKTLQLLDRWGVVVRSVQVGTYKEVQSYKKRWKQLYGNSQAYKDASYKLVENT